MYYVLPSFTMLDESFGDLVNGVTPDGEHDSVGSLQGKEGTEMKASQRRNTELVDDVLMNLFPGQTCGYVQTVGVCQVRAFLFLFICDPPSEVRLAGVVEKAGNILSKETVEVSLNHLQGAQEFRLEVGRYRLRWSDSRRRVRIARVW